MDPCGGRWHQQAVAVQHRRVVPGRGARRDAQYQALHGQAEKSYEETLAELYGPAFSLEGSPALPETVESSQRETAPRAAVAPVRDLADWAWREEMESDRDEAAREIAAELHLDHADRDGRER